MADADPRGVRPAFHEAAAHLVATVGSLDAPALDGAGTRDWTMRELVAHAGRAFVATEVVLDAVVDPKTPRLASAAAYFRMAMSSPSVHEGITRRARDAAASLGDQPAPALQEQYARIAPRVDATPLTTEVQHAAGRLEFGAYLATRICELVLHAADVELALGRAPSAPEGSSRLVRDVMVELADRPDPLGVACVLSGRAYPAGCNVLG